MNTPYDPLTLLLREAYVTPEPPPAFVESLLRDLQCELAPVPRRRLRPAVLACAVAASVSLLALLLAPLLRTRPSPPIADKTVAPQSPASTHGSPPGLGKPSLRLQISRAEWIVLVHVVSWKDGLVDYKVERVVYGELGDPLIRIDKRSYIDSYRPIMRRHMAKLGKQDVDDAALTEAILADIHVAKGERALLYLAPPIGQLEGIRVFQQVGAAYDVPPNHGIEDVERQIVKLIAEGKNVELLPGSELTQALDTADLVVCAELAQLDEEKSRWTVLRSTKGQTKAQSVVIDHGLWRLRAGTIVRYQLGADQLPEHELAKRIAAEASRLIHAELRVGRQAILFLDNVRSDGASGQAALRRLILEDASGKHLDEMEEAIRHPPERSGAEDPRL